MKLPNIVYGSEAEKISAACREQVAALYANWKPTKYDDQMIAAFLKRHPEIVEELRMPSGLKKLLERKRSA